MRPLEIAILVLLTASALRPLLPWRMIWLELLPLASLIVAVIHLVVEGYRWQMIPLYAIVMVFSLIMVRGLTTQPQEAPKTGMRMLARVIPILVLLILAVAPGILFPVPNIAEPSGPYHIGTTSFFLVDTGRQEIYGKDPTAPRELVAQVWYPAELDPTAPQAPWLTGIDKVSPAIARKLGLPPFILSHLSLAQGHARQDAPIAQSGSPFPVLLFSHGWTGFRSQNTFQIESLVSHGYVVAAVDHTYATPATLFPDGRIIQGNPDALPDDAPLPELDRAAKKLVAQWVGDLDYLLDHLEALNINDPQGMFTGHLNLDQVGVLGHSTGGGATLEFCGRDNRCQAGLAMDAFVLPVSQDVLEAGLVQPFLFMWSEAWPWDANTERFQELEPNLTGVTYQLSITGTAHYDFTDLPLLTPVASMIGLKGPLNGPRAFEIINSYTLAFFDRHLRNLSESPMEQLNSSYPEVRMYP